MKTAFARHSGRAYAILGTVSLLIGCVEPPGTDTPPAGAAHTQSSALGTETVTATVEISNIPYDTNITPTNLFSQVLHANGRTWFVGRNPSDGRPYVWQKSDGPGTTATAYPIDTGSPTYTSTGDSHHNWSIGIDSAGYLHVMGDMHNYPYGPSPLGPCGSDTPAGSVEWSPTYLPERLRCQLALYWRSNTPYDAAGGFTFRGGSTSTAPNAVSLTYPRFIHAPNGDLYFTSLGKALRDTSSKRTGQMAVLLHKYNPATGGWNAIGGSVSGLVTDTPSAQYTTYFPAFFWENGGLNDGSAHPWFQGFQHQFRFDMRGNMHFCAAINVDPSSNKNTRLLYAFSPDGGTTWKRANGTTIGGLPLRAAGSSNMADLVTDTQDAYSLGDYTVVTADRNGRPACRPQHSPSHVNGGAGQWFYWNGAAWTTGLDTDSLAGVMYYFDPLATVGPDHNVTFIDTGSATFRRTDSFTSPSSKSQNLLTGMRSFKTVSDKGLWDNGALYGVGFFGNPVNSLQIVRVTAVPANTVNETYSLTTTGIWDKGPYSLLAGQQLRMTVVPASGNTHNVSNEIWTSGYGSKLTSTVGQGTTVTAYTAGLGAAAARIYTGSASVSLTATITRPAIQEHATRTSIAGLQTQGPYALRAGQTIRQEIYPAAGNSSNISNEIWNGALTTKLAGNISTGNQYVEYTAPSDMSVYVGTYTGVANMTFNLTVVR